MTRNNSSKANEAKEGKTQYCMDCRAPILKPLATLALAQRAL